MIKTKMQEQKIPGYVAGVYANGRVQWTEGFGYAHLEQRALVRPSTRFRIGSVSKSFTAAALARLVEEGRLDLDVPIPSGNGYNKRGAFGPFCHPLNC